MNFQIEIGQFALMLNVAVRLVTALIFMAFIIPLQIREAFVKNGLKKLRYELLAVGLIVFMINTVGLSVIVVRYYFGNDVFKLATDIVTILNTLGFFFVALVQYQVYHHKYTPEQKELHAKFDRMEVEAAKKAEQIKSNSK